MLAPCMTVLSTSKNAAAVGSAGWSSAVSTSAAAAAASPASVDRCWRLPERALARAVASVASRDASKARRKPCWAQSSVRNAARRP